MAIAARLRLIDFDNMSFNEISSIFNKAKDDLNLFLSQNWLDNDPYTLKNVTRVSKFMNRNLAEFNYMQLKNYINSIITLLEFSFIPDV